MPFDKETARLAGQKSKRGKAKKLEPNIKEKMELLYEEVLDHLIMRHELVSGSLYKLPDNYHPIQTILYVNS